MTLFSILFCYMREKPISTFFQILLMAFGTMIITSLLLFGHQLNEKFYQTGHGIDAVIGAKGSPLQLVLSTLHHIDIPTGNISLKDAEYIQKHPQIKKSIPMALGDNYRGIHILGTDKSYLEHFNAIFSKGTGWNASLQTVIGHNIAKETHLDIGDYFIASHGMMASGHAHDNMPYQVVGILKKNYSTLDNLILTSLQTVWDVHHHGGEKDITALLVSYKNRNAAFSFPRIVNKNTNIMAASPALEMARLSKMIGIGEKTLTIFGAFFILFATIAIALNLAQNIQQRQYDLAIFRSLGASPRKIMMLILFEAALIILIGQIIGLILGHSLLEYFQLPNLHMTGYIFISEVWYVNIMVFIFSLFVCLIPAVKAYNTDIAVLLQND